MMADSLKWSNLSTSAFTTIAKIISINYNGTFSMYDRDSLGREINTFLPGRTDGRWFRMEGTNLAAGFRVEQSSCSNRRKATDKSEF
jgi:hypothetical protein